MRTKNCSWLGDSMVFHNWMHPGQRLLTVLTLFLLQGAARGWIFPKRNIEITLPEDYPLNVPFYRLSVIPSKRDIAKNTSIEYSMKVLPFRKGDSRVSAVKKEQFVKLDKNTGIFILVKSLPSSGIRGRRRHRIFMNITLSGNSKNDKSWRKCEILIEFSGSMDDYCAPKLKACFPDMNVEYSVPENTVINADLDYLMNPGLISVCPNMTLYYSVISDYNVVSVNSSTGAVQLISGLDADEFAFLSFRVMCTVERKDFMMQGNISLIDVNDNPPTTRGGNSSQQIIRYVKPNERDLNFQVLAVDKDSKSVNNLVAMIENDSFNLFTVQPLTEYESLDSPKSTFYAANIYTNDLQKHPFTEYNFTVVVEDKALHRHERRVVFDVTIIKETYHDIELQEVYDVNISRKATDFARILQLSHVSLSNYRFSLGNWRKDKDWLSITNKSGIVFIQNSSLMTNKSSEQRKIMWWKKDESHEIEGSSILIINIDEGGSENCGDVGWCSYYGSREKCISNCGKGSSIGRCSWRDEPLITLNPSNKYSACSPDFKTCPDGHCDELEEMDSAICPLDCAKDIIGARFRSDSKLGVGNARGVCSCLTTTRCGCNPAPAEMRFFRENDAPNKTSLLIEVKNITFVDAVKKFGDDETSTPVEMIPVPGLMTDGSCGIGCVVLASMIPCGILVLIVTVIVVRRFRTNHMSHLKVGGSRISLSAVPSDYVQERPNSVQDSRTTTSETSTKTILDPKWEFPRNRLQFQTILGEGEFGKVIKAQASNIAGMKGLTTVAVKMLKENGSAEEMHDLISEFTLLKDISHPHVIKLLGACTEKGGPFYLIVEYAEMGSLRSYLRKRRKHNNCCKYNATYGIQDVNAEPPREYYQFLCERSRYEPRHCFFHKEQLSFAWQIAKGMSYLADMKLVHRDLAARNILLDKKKVAKISDFGLSRDIYKGEAYLKKTKGRVPVKWLAIESLEDQIYTSRSDVWSFGIVMWEIMMQGATPYPGVTPQRLFNLLKAGYRMSKPEFCPDELYTIMRLCWRKNPHERPSFKELVQKVEGLLHDTEEYMDLGTKTHSNINTIDRPLLSFGDPSSSIQYTSVLIDNEEEFYDVDSLENIGLVNLFNEEIEASKTSSDKESVA